MSRRPAPVAPSLTALATLAALTLVSCGNAESTAPEPSPDSAVSTPPAEAPEPGEGAEPPVPQEPADPQASESESESDPGSAEEPEDSAEAEALRPPGSGPPPGGAERMAEDELDEDVHGQEGELDFYTVEGAEVGVAGLDPSEDPLPVYAEPTRSSDITAELQSLDAVSLAGRERNHTDEPEPGTQQGEEPAGAAEDFGSWTEIELAEGYGWFQRATHDGDIYWFGGTTEVTEDFEDIPAAQDPRELAESVGARVAELGQEPGLDDPDLGTSWVLLSEPADFDEDFYRIDVTGFMGHSVAGNRLLVHMEETTDGHELARVEQTLICVLGVDEGGLCS